MIIVDTHLIGYLYLKSEYAQHVERALRQDADWAAPLLWRSEFCNVLALYLRKRWLSLGQIQQIMAAALALMDGREYEVDSHHVLRLVATSNCSAYDCEFVALAQELGVSLVTMDKQILKDFPEVAVPLAAYVRAQG